jgi:dynein heavy chain
MESFQKCLNNYIRKLWKAVIFFKILISGIRRIPNFRMFRATFPEPWQTKLDDFEKLLVLKCLRPDKVINAMQIYLSKNLGQQFVEPQTVELSVIYNESTNTTPILFILSLGTDPATDLYKFADKLKMTKKLLSISLGQGQGPTAKAMLKESLESGNWVFFQVRIPLFLFYFFLIDK